MAPRAWQIFTVVSKADGTVVARAQGEPFFGIHQINCFERDGAILQREAGLDYRTAYAAGGRKDRPEGFYNQLLRFDLRGHQVRRWFEDGCFPGEPVFLPRPNGADHLEGVVVSVVLDGKRGRSFLLVLDAQSFEEVGRAFASHVLPFGFHGEFKN